MTNAMCNPCQLLRAALPDKLGALPLLLTKATRMLYGLSKYTNNTYNGAQHLQISPTWGYLCFVEFGTRHTEEIPLFGTEVAARHAG